MVGEGDTPPKNYKMYILHGSYDFVDGHTVNLLQEIKIFMRRTISTTQMSLVNPSQNNFLVFTETSISLNF